MGYLVVLPKDSTIVELFWYCIFAGVILRYLNCVVSLGVVSSYLGAEALHFLQIPTGGVPSWPLSVTLAFTLTLLNLVLTYRFQDIGIAGRRRTGGRGRRTGGRRGRRGRRRTTLSPSICHRRRGRRTGGRRTGGRRTGGRRRTGGTNLSFTLNLGFLHLLLTFDLLLALNLGFLHLLLTFHLWILALGNFRLLSASLSLAWNCEVSLDANTFGCTSSNDG